MKKTVPSSLLPIVSVIALLLAGTGATVSAAPIDFELKVGAGLSLLLNGVGDLESARLGLEAYTTDWAGPYYSAAFDWDKTSLLPPWQDFRAELVLKLGRHFGVGLGLGYQSLSSTSTFAFMYDRTYHDTWGTTTFNYDDAYAQDYTVSNIPIFLNVYGFLPMRNITLFAYLGPSLNVGSFDHTQTETDTENIDFDSSVYPSQKDYYTYTATLTNKARCTAFGFQGGLGVQVRLSSVLAVGLEAYGRAVNFSDWTGTSNYDWDEEERLYYEPWGWWATLTNNGSDSYAQATLYSYDWTWSENRHSYAVMAMFETGDPPSGSGISNVRLAKLNFNALGVLLGLIIHF